MRLQLPEALILFLGLTTTAAACELHQHLPQDTPVDSLKGPYVRQKNMHEVVHHLTATAPRDWTYADSKNWGYIKPEYALCNNGTQQSPINLSSYGLAQTHQPSFANYDRTVKGDLFNWGFGPSFTLHTTNGIRSLPELQFDSTTVHLRGWHMHFPAEHLIANRRSQAELHLVHTDVDGNPAAVIGILVDVGSPSDNFNTVPKLPDPDSGAVIEDVGANVWLAIKEAGGLTDYYTYKGSLTTPGCNEGLRWFVSSDVLEVSQKQMDALLASNGGRYSAREPQRVVNQRVNV